MKKLRYVIIIVSILVLGAAVSPSGRYFEIAKNLDIFATLFKEVNTYYVDEVDPDKLIRTGIDAMLSSLDPYTNYIPEEDVESFRSMTTGQYAGIGALIGKINGEAVITMPYEGFAAHKAGLQIGDILVEVDGVKLKEKQISDISTLLKGPSGSEVKVKVKRYGLDSLASIVIRREKININNVPYFGMVAPKTGYIRLEDFTTDASKEVKNALIELKSRGAENLILDVRSNPGGLLSEAVNIANLFIPKGKEVVSTKGKVAEWNKSYKTLNRAEDTQIPLVILANGGSASASEIVSGVIQDYDRGILIGTTTFGKGLVQTTRPLSYNSQLKVTTAKYYIPSGRCIQSIDYENRNDEGNAEKIADSLKAEFRTTNGRKVYDGEGLSPDIEIENENLSPLTVALITEGLIFNYANEFYASNEVSASPEEFILSNDQYQQFIEWLEDKNYSYFSDTEETFERLIASAKKEKYYDDIEKQLDQLRKQIAHDPKKDLKKFKEEVKTVLEQEIVLRKYLQKGQIRASFKSDKQLQKAVEVLNSSDLYKKILAGD